MVGIDPAHRDSSLVSPTTTFSAFRFATNPACSHGIARARTGDIHARPPRRESLTPARIGKRPSSHDFNRPRFSSFDRPSRRHASPQLCPASVFETLGAPIAVGMRSRSGRRSRSRPSRTDRGSFKLFDPKRRMNTGSGAVGGERQLCVGRVLAATCLGRYCLSGPSYRSPQHLRKFCRPPACRPGMRRWIDTLG